MPVVTTTQAGTFEVPGSYIYEEPATAVAPVGPNTSIVGYVGTNDWLTPNVPLPVSGGSAAVSQAIGNNTQLPHSLADAALNGTLPETTSHIFCRVTDNTDLAAYWQILDDTGFASANIIVGGTFSSGQTATISVTPPTGSPTTTVTYVVGANGDTTLAELAAQLNSRLAGSVAAFGSQAYITTAENGSTISVTAAASGTNGNNIGLTVSITSGSVTLSASSSYLAGGGASGVVQTFYAVCTGSRANSTPLVPIGGRCDAKSLPGSSSPVYRITAFFAGGVTETFDNIIAYATPNGGYDATTFQTNAAIAFNSGTKARAASSYWTSSAGESINPPTLGVLFPASGGTDGAEGVGTQQLIGTDGGTRTGIYALRNLLGGGQFIVAGLTDLSVAQILATFCQEERCFTAIALGPAGTTLSEAETTIADYGLSSQFVAIALGWTYVIDPTTFVPQLEDPAHALIGTLASLNPWESALNKPVTGKGNIIGTEWTVGGQMPDEADLQSSNICYFKQYGGNWVNFESRASDGTLISDTRMLNYLSLTIEAIGVKYVGRNQPAIAGNPVIQEYLNDVKALLQPLVDPNNKRISAYNVSDGGNTVTSIEQGFLIGRTSVQTLSGIEFILNILQVGNAVSVQQAATPSVLSS